MHAFETSTEVRYSTSIIRGHLQTFVQSRKRHRHTERKSADRRSVANIELAAKRRLAGWLAGSDERVWQLDETGRGYFKSQADMQCRACWLSLFTSGE